MAKKKCFICGEDEVGWESDFTFDEYGIEDRNGLVQNYVCLNCGADYEVYVENPWKQTEKLLPEFGQKVLAVLPDNGVIALTFSKSIREPFERIVKAWMPMPKYKEKNDDD